MRSVAGQISKAGVANAVAASSRGVEPQPRSRPAGRSGELEAARVVDHDLPARSPVAPCSIRVARTVIGAGGTIQPSRRGCRVRRRRRRRTSRSMSPCANRSVYAVPCRGCRPARWSARSAASARSRGRCRRGRPRPLPPPASRSTRPAGTGSRSVHISSQARRQTSSRVIGSPFRSGGGRGRRPRPQGHAQLGQAAAPGGADAADRHVEVGGDLAVVGSVLEGDDPQQPLAALGELVDRLPQSRSCSSCSTALCSAERCAGSRDCELLVLDRDVAAGLLADPPRLAARGRGQPAADRDRRRRSRRGGAPAPARSSG